MFTADVRVQVPPRPPENHRSRKTSVIFFLSKKRLAEFAAAAVNNVKSIFDRGVYLGENTYQAASVEFIRHGRTSYARSRLQKPVEKPRGGIFDSLKHRSRKTSVLFFFRPIFPGPSFPNICAPSLAAAASEGALLFMECLHTESGPGPGSLRRTPGAGTPPPRKRAGLPPPWPASRH